MNDYPKQQITGAILAGGRARRMGGEDKGLLRLAGREMAVIVAQALRPQVGALVLNANRNIQRYEELGFTVVGDEMTGFQGPLAGMASVLSRIDTPWLVTVPCDGPFLPPDLVGRLYHAMHSCGAELAVAHDGRRMQPVYSLLRRELLDSLREFLAGGDRKIDRWYARHRHALADFSDAPDTFLNINTPGDLEALDRGMTGLNIDKSNNQ